ncbi:13367_t:CDS:10 [Funneliformis mosseae]|uniref:Phosphatidate cytidylyltransferase n=1 Tax=Funneliformis mosseae TaxID=27381 RepID=A0A9N9AUM5_FUNMO|nr:13367_t:CDS:10 [Funneliformis mosseae]
MTKKRKGGKHENYEAEQIEELPTKVNGLEKSQDISKDGLLASQPSTKKWKNMAVRSIWTFVMIFGFFAILALGTLWVILLVCVIQTLVYKEVIAIAHVPSKEKKLPWFKTLNWYFLISTNYFLYGESIIYYFKEIVLVDAFLLPFATHHRFISFTLYCIGFVLFVGNLKRGHYKFQFTQFAWTHMTLLIVFSNFIRFILPVSLVICNDIFAYMCGFFWGKTPLIKLSPKKTWEGFVGAWICTIIFGFFWSSLLSRWDYIICPAQDLTTTAFSGKLTCAPNPVFIPQRYDLNPWLTSLFRRITFADIRSVGIAPLQWHVLVMACFASLIAPFGGFFASGVKRAFKIKDFGDSIPGHGGITDRMDCQFLMGLFSHMYYQSFIKTSSFTVGSVLEAIISLDTPDQMYLYEKLKQYLISQDLLKEDQD